MPDTGFNGTPEPLVARYSIPKLFSWIGASGAMAGLCLAVSLGVFGDTGPLIAAVGFGGALFFGLIAVVFAKRLFDRREQVVISADGLFVRAHGAKLVGLRSIDRMKIDTGKLSFYLFKPSKYPIESWHRRWMYRVNGSEARAFYGDVWLWSSYLDQPLSAFPDAIRSHRPMTDHEKKIAEVVRSWDENGGPHGTPADN